MISDFTHTDEASGIQFVARAIRRDKGQLRADVSIRFKGRELDRDEFRFSDRQKRNALAGSAFLSLGGATTLPGKKEEMQLLLRQFNDCVEEVWQGSLAVEDVPGLAEPETPPWVVHGLVQEGAGTLLVGPPGAGKSQTGMLIAQSVQYAISTVFRVYGPRPVLYVNLERSKRSLQNRLGMVNRVLGLPPTTEMPQINARGKRWTDVQEVVRRRLESDPPELVVLDSLSRMGMGSMSEDDVANGMMDEMNAMGVAWMAIAHPPRASGPGKAARLQAEHAFGSQMITAAADFEIIMRAKDQPGLQTLIGLKVKKANDAGKIPLAGWLYRYGEGGLIGANRADFVSEEDFEEA